MASFLRIETNGFSFIVDSMNIDQGELNAKLLTLVGGLFAPVAAATPVAAPATDESHSVFFHFLKHGEKINFIKCLRRLSQEDDNEGHSLKVAKDMSENEYSAIFRGSLIDCKRYYNVLSAYAYLTIYKSDGDAIAVESNND